MANGYPQIAPAFGGPLGGRSPSQPMSAGGIYEWLRQQAMGMGGPQSAPAFGGPFGGAQSSPRGAQPPPIVPGEGGPASFAPPSPRRGGTGGAPFPSLEQMGATPEQVTAATKTERSPLQFAWGRGTPEDYEAGTTDILKMQGAPSGRSGFMGAQPDDPASAGGFILPPQAPGGGTDWANVANPMASEAYREQPAIEEQRRFMEDPMWREREQGEIEKERDLGVGVGIAEAQAGLVQEREEQMLNDYLDGQVAMAQSQRRADNQPLMTPAEIEAFRQAERGRMLAGALGGGLGGGLQVR